MRGRLQPLTFGGKNKVFKCIDWSSIATFNAPHIGGHLALDTGCNCNLRIHFFVVFTFREQPEIMNTVAKLTGLGA